VAEGSKQPVPGTLSEIISEPDAFVRAERLAAELRQLGPEAVPEVVQIIRVHRETLGATETTLLVRFWADFEPRTAAEWALGRSPRAFRLSLSGHAIEHWAFKDPIAAVRYIASFAVVEADASRVYQRALVRGWYWSGTPGLEGYIHALGPSFERQRMLEVLIEEMLTKEGPEAVEAWLVGIPDEDKKYKLAAHRRLVRVFAKRDPARAVAWCREHGDGPFGDGLEQVLMRNWASVDPATAHEWLLTLPEGSEKTEAAGTHMDSWLGADAEAADAWMKSRGVANTEPWMSTAITRYAIWLSSSARLDYQSAIAWSTLPAVQKDRVHAMRVVFRRWRGRDLEAASAWLASVSLPDDERAVLDKVAARKRKRKTKTETEKVGVEQAEPSA
jgi:hypothetical protein